MAVQDSSNWRRRMALGAAGVALAALGGCVVAPVGPYDVGAPVVYSDTVYAPAYSYGPYGPAYVPYYAAPWAPSVSLGIYGGFGSGPRWNGPYGGGHGHGRPPGYGGGHGPRPPGAGPGQRPPGAGGGAARPPSGGQRWYGSPIRESGGPGRVR